MNYIGSKLSLLKFLDESVSKITNDECKTFCDLFAGTGVVGAHFKKKGYRVIANDIQYYSYVLNRHYIGNNSELKFNRLFKEIPGLENISIEERKNLVCAFLSNVKGVRGFIYNNYCLGGTKYKKEPRRYFSDENGMLCDAVRLKIENWKERGLIPDDEYYFLLASLIESSDKYANTASVYGAFLKKLKRTARAALVIKPAELIKSNNKHKVYNTEINKLVENIGGDIFYLDPPYNHRQYATNYHLPETIARYDNPEIHGKTGLRNYDGQKSLYCSRTQIKKTFRDLILKIKAKYIFLSYNNEGLLTLADIKELMSLRGKYGYFTKTYDRFKADRTENRSYSADKTTEYLHYVVCNG